LLSRDKSCTRDMGALEDAQAVSMMLTRRCNMTCAHCSVHSGPKIREEPTRDELIATLHSAADAGIRSVQITGGEPMIREDIVFELLRVAKKRGMMTTMSSNGFWGKRQSNAWRTVAALKRADLKRVTISYDRYHAQFQGPQPALNIARAAEWFNLPMNINITRVVNDPEIANIVAPFEKRHQLKMRFYDVQEVGRARELPIAELRGETSGYCTACCVPAITDDGRITACNGPSYFLDETSPLVIGSFRKTPMAQLIQKHTNDPILETIRRVGPERLLHELEDAGVARELGIRRQHSGLCDLCMDINTNPAAVSVLRERLSTPQHQATLAARRMVIFGGSAQRTLGIEYANGVGAANLWMDAAAGRFDRFDANAEAILGRADFDWNRATTYLVQCGVSRSLAPMLSRRSLKRWAPSFFVERISRAAIREGLHDLTQREIVRRLNDALEAISAKGVLLKGGAILSLDAHHPGSLARRAAGDIDIYVSPARAGELRTKLLQSGFTGASAAERTGPHHLAPVSFSGVSVEIHTSIMPSFWGLPEAEMLGRARSLPDFNSLSTLDTEGMILHALVHTSAHVFSHGLRAAWDVVWLLERFPSVDAALLLKWVKQLEMPRSFWVPANVMSKGFVQLPRELTNHIPRDERQSRLERVADLRMFSAIENAFEINPISKNGFFLLLHDSNFGRARHVAALFRPEERESRRSAAKMLKEAETPGNHSLLRLQLREGMTHWKQFRSLANR
jgi:organic radical activating enzyme